MKSNHVAWIFGSWAMVMTCFLAAQVAIRLNQENVCKPVAHHERQLSPHEQQPEPIPAVMQGGVNVERWVL